ncbi:PREDICTED: F-box protein At2g39490-like isoform X2 [Ipomoea nil]|uniref:F-box protein At2g39490-like isoform X2 n=1 Tax=Ipomoea nil TaxID=35883 RepID=UPI000900BDFC|nr:PREDICTED: F-box protein At2g39490-like isoform X2 [Ipomoea nil]
MGKKMNKKNKSQSHRQHVLQDDDGRRHGCNYHILPHLSDYHSDEEVKEDFISNLPDDILSEILSLIPLDSAVKTAALSTRWKDFWGKTLTLNGSKEGMFCAVGDLVSNFDVECPFKHPRKLQYSYGSSGLVLVASLGLKAKLHLDFSKGKLDFPRDFGWQLILNTTSHLHHPPQHSVRNLDLTSVNYLTSDAVSCIASNLGFIESLTIRKCEGLRSLRLEADLGLQNLTIVDCSRLKSLAVEAYELQAFRFRGPLCWFSLEGVESLEDVKLECREGPGYGRFKYQDYDALLLAMRDVKILTLSGWIFKEIMMPWLCNGHENFRFTELKELWWIDSSEQNIEAALMSFLQFSPSLQRLFITIDPSSFNAEPSKMASKERKQAKLRHLKLVKLEGFADGEERIISLKERLIDGFNVEPRMVIVTKGSQPRCLIRIPRHRGKGNPNNGASKKKASYKFVEEIEDNAGLCCPHIHML